MISRKVPLREVYVWELPVRIFHWVNAFVITVLIITGYIIGDPPAIMHGTAPEFNYWFGWVRLAHFIAAFIFVTNFLVRIYWFFAGNSFARWNNYIPLTKKQWRGIYDTLKVDIFLLSPKPVYDIGHNSLAAVTYLGLFVLIIIQSLTGFAMYSVASNGIFAPFFEKLLIACNGFYPIRNIHHNIMWLFILFAVIHIYLVFYHDYIERNGIASSIIGGWKFIGEPLVKEHEEEIKEKESIEENKEIVRKLKKQQKTDHEINISSGTGKSGTER